MSCMKRTGRVAGLLFVIVVAKAFVVNHQRVPLLSRQWRTHTYATCTTRYLSNNDEDSWDDDVDYDDILAGADDESKIAPDPSTNWNDSSETPKLGIDIGAQLEPLTPEQVQELKDDATEVINKEFSKGLEEIEKLRTKMTLDLNKSKKAMDFASELNAQRESEKLLSKIDKMTEGFLSSTEKTRRGTKMAAKADSSMKDKGLEMGSWGTVGDAVVTTSGSGLLGSVDAATANKQDSKTPEDEDSEEVVTENRILIVADEPSDPLAKQVLSPLIMKLEEAVPGVQIQTLKPTATMPLGADNALVLVVFATSLSDASGLGNLYGRALRRTLSEGGVNKPPTQLVCISTLGTERTDKFPYSMQNLMGGKLEKRRQMEEVTISTVQRHMSEPPLDYTIVKLGEIKDGSGAFEMAPGDVLDGTTSSDVAAEVLLQAIAFQPAARNATLCAVGSSAVSDEAWDEEFIRLDGPELWRVENVVGPKDQLVEYLSEWGELLQENKRLTTPLRTEISSYSDTYPVKERYGVRLLFLPTRTGSAYQSKSEERARERETSTGTTQSSSSSTPPPPKRQKKEGGIEVMVEITATGEMRVRARRCNMQDDTVIKELSEATILKRLEDAMNVWAKDHSS